MKGFFNGLHDRHKRTENWLAVSPEEEKALLSPRRTNGGHHGDHDLYCRQSSSHLVNDSKLKTHELAVTINSNLHHLMILRAPEAIQATLKNIVEEN